MGLGSDVARKPGIRIPWLDRARNFEPMFGALDYFRLARTRPALQGKFRTLGFRVLGFSGLGPRSLFHALPCSFLTGLTCASNVNRV